MKLPNRPPAWANHITRLLQAVEKATGQSLYPVRIQDIAMDLSRNLFPDAPLTRISGENLGNRFEGMLARVPGTANEWGINPIGFFGTQSGTNSQGFPFLSY